MKVIQVKISDLKPAEYNPRALTKKEAKDLKTSLERFGMVEPIVVNKAKGRENVIIGGHQRFYLWKELGNKTMPVVYVDIPDIEKERELNLRLNKNLGHWDWDMLANFDENLLRDVGFVSEELDKLSKPIKEDDLIEPGDKARSKLGEVYRLGNHKLICGDSTKIEVYKKLFDKEKANMIFTDPPYNIDYSYDWREELHGGKKVKHRFFSDKKTDKEYSDFIRDCFVNGYSFSVDEAAFYCWYNMRYHEILRLALKEAGWRFSQTIIWVKDFPNFPQPQGFSRTFEPCLYGWKKGKKVYANKMFSNFRDIVNYDDLQQLIDLWYEKRDSIFEYEHPTQKPVRLAERAIKKSSKIGDIVLDMFGGSGSTLIACEQLKRKCYMIELDPLYCDVIRKRYARFIGKEEQWEEITKVTL